MKTVEVIRQISALKSVIRSAGHHSSNKSMEMMSHWAKYACVVEAGIVENIVRNVYGAMVGQQASTRVASFARAQLEGVQNPKCDKLVKIAASFDRSWGKDLDVFLKLDFRQDAINAVMSNRHLIAHGRNCNITIAQVSLYLGKIEEVGDYIEGQCGV
ncbi:HEPN domain-containing protein [Arenimonas sp.]|uniref:HEPN domain-containing protein n=1 Tax=Arenimonas sp. TaxID=1872635 RepID=UPI0039E6C5E2